MARIRLFSSLLLSVLLSCNSGTEVVESSSSPESPISGKSIVMGGAGKRSNPPTNANPMTGSIRRVKVLNIQSGDRYSYIQAQEGKRTYWITTWKIGAKRGDSLFFHSGILKVNMFSKNLNKQLDTMYMVSHISPTLEGLMAPKSPPSTAIQGNSPAPPDNAPVVSIADLNAHPERYEGKFVTVMGKSVKVNNHILGKNWIHIQSANGDDIAITTQDILELGTPCTFTGKVYKDLDFGSGYRFEVLIQEAKLIQ